MQPGRPRVVNPLIIHTVRSGGVEEVEDASGHARSAGDAVKPAAHRPVAEAAQKLRGGSGAPVDENLISAGRKGKRRKGTRKLAVGEDGAGADLRDGRVVQMRLAGSEPERTAAAVGAVGTERAGSELTARAAVVAVAVGGGGARLGAATLIRSIGRVDRSAGREVIEEHDCEVVWAVELHVDDGALALIQQRGERRERGRERRSSRRRGRRRRQRRRGRRRTRRWGWRRFWRRRRQRRRLVGVTRAAVVAIVAERAL